MALRFGRKKTDETAASGETGREAVAFEPQPDKARTLFEHARAAADKSHYEYALKLYAEGIGLDPTLMSAHEAMYDAAVKYGRAGGKPASGREIRNIEGESRPVEKFAAAEFAWLKDLNNASLAIKFLEASIKVIEWGGEAGRLHCQRILNVLRRQKKPSKSLFLAARELFPALGAWDEAIAAAEDALRLDPNDGALENEIKDLSAQRAMDQGGYEATQEEGGFRKSIKDAGRQRELVEAESISGGLDIEQRNLTRARAEYEQSPGVPDVINKYGQLLKAVGTDESRQQAHDVFMKGYRDTGQYRFRAAAGDILIERAQAQVKALAAQMEQVGANSDVKARYDESRRKALDLQAGEYAERVKEYPTDRRLKLQLGEVRFEMGAYEGAMPYFQEARDDPQLRVRAQSMLGRAFAAKGWHDMAIQEFKEALDRLEAGDKERELAIRYELMVCLMERAAAERSIELAREALEICSTIARKDITYRDIRARRTQADELVKSLGAPPADG